ncbi:acylphosphatase [Halomonas urumqiensis]|uniref:acylphosphatase n=1 Tax=Halomonas urumqiensis TaxID=1684789 RepID=A0A2N7UPL1_9GAMM|nr:acylphosphatase [Halomonas urumqiensis]PMR82377.1 acylphosphatase [Halomonas urumqiensis]PTB04144.1 acylphosphatase [Halomonas urumqiensis]GHE19588.1 acylphosphatase [Halomonas urumqiensis]
MDKCCVKAVVTGKVQGVWFRRATEEQALTHGLTGHARNLPDGRVEVLLCGQRDAVSTVSQWLWKGPPNARVTHVELEVVEMHDPDHFVAR